MIMGGGLLIGLIVLVLLVLLIGGAVVGVVWFARQGSGGLNLGQLFPLALLALLLAACGTPTTPPAGPRETTKGFLKNADGYADITVEQLAELLMNKDFAMVNVHIPYEGELEQTDLFIPFDEIADHLGELPAKDAPIVLYCRSGSMSTTAAEVLADQGYTNVMELDGGFNAWKAAGYEFLDKR